MRFLPFSAALWVAIAAPAIAQTITINGSGAPGQTVSGSTMAVVSAGGSGDKTDALYVCVIGGNCAPANGLDYDYLNGTKTETPSPPYPTGGSFNMNVPGATGNYKILWYQADTNTNVTSLTFTVSSSPPPPTAPTIDMSDGSHIAPVTGDVLGVNGNGAWAPIAAPTGGSQGPAGPPGPQGPAGQNGTNGTNAGQVGLFTPTSSTMACSQGQSGFDATYIYACLATNQWGRMGGGQTSWQTTGW